MLNNISDLKKLNIEKLQIEINMHDLNGVSTILNDFLVIIHHNNVQNNYNYYLSHAQFLISEFNRCCA